MAELGDLLTRIYELDEQMYRFATKRLSYTDAEWDAIKRGG